MNENPAPPAAPADSATTGPRDFFEWIRSLRLVRSDAGWLGGVCAGVAQRTGLDVMIIRGIAVVIALLGGPIFLFYAIGWALMPDTRGQILLQQLLRGVFHPAMIAIGIMTVLTFLPFMRGLWWQGAPLFWGMPDWLEVTLTVGWSLALAAGVIWLIVFLATRRPSCPPSGQSSPAAPNAFASASTASSPAPSPAPSSFADSASTPPNQSTATVSDKTDAWARTVGDKADEWGRTVGDKADEWGRTAGAKADTWGKNFDESVRQATAAHRAAQPGAGFVAIVLGVALIVGAVTASISGVAAVTAERSTPELLLGIWTPASLVLGLAATTVVLGLGVVIAGVRGRTSGTVGFLSILSIVALVFTGVLPSGTQFVPFGTATWSLTQSTPSTPQGFAMIAGSPTLDASDLVASAADRGGVVDVWVGFGQTDLILPTNAPVQVEVNGLAGNVHYPDSADRQRTAGVLFHDTQRLDDRGSGNTERRSVSETRAAEARAAETPVVGIRVWVLAGNVTVAFAD